jgi:hypothetical protein
MATLIFIDTNILLDFYRIQGRENSLSILKLVDHNHNKIITGRQVEMEYKKNRQKQILKTLDDFKAPNWSNTNPPAFLRAKQAVKGIKKRKVEITRDFKALKKTADAILKNPARNDLVYKTCQRLFKSSSELNLKRTNPIRFEIQSLARERFDLGYPPRKDEDTSIGDAINWEWIVQCAKANDANIILATRDSDYGVIDKELVNDWLAQEFRERVGGGRTLSMTSRLTKAFERSGVRVTKKEKNAEEQQITALPRLLQFDIMPTIMGKRGSAELIQSLLGVSGRFATTPLLAELPSHKSYRPILPVPVTAEESSDESD